MFINGLSGHGVWLDRMIASFSQYGPLIFGVYLIWLWFSGTSPVEREENRKNALYAFFAAILAMAINQAIGFMWYRNRPFVDHRINRLVSTAQDASFPSDHAAGGFSIAWQSVVGTGVMGRSAALTGRLRCSCRYPAYMSRVHYPSTFSAVAVGLISSIIVERNRTFWNDQSRWSYPAGTSSKPIQIRGVPRLDESEQVLRTMALI
jgi:undecaprenyl-diphosphatase